MPTRDHQGNMGIGRIFVFEANGTEMSLKVMNTDQGNVPSVGDRFGGLQSDQKRANQRFRYRRYARS